MITVLIIISLIIAILLQVYITKLNNSEYFINKDIIVYSSNKLNDKEWLETISNNSWNIESASLEQLNNLYTLILQKSPLKILPYSEVYIVADPFDYDKYLTQFKVKSNGTTGYFVLLTSKNRAYKWDCSYNLQGKNIGYFDKSDLYFIKSMCYGYKQQMDSISFQQINYNDIQNLSMLLNSSQIDLVITYVIPNSEFFNNLQLQDIAMSGFKDLDIHRLRAVYPYITNNNKRIPDIFTLKTGAQMHYKMKDNDELIPAMNKKLVQIKFKTTNQENFENQKPVLQNEYTDPAYRCYGDTLSISKGACESPVDVSSIPKRNLTRWDKPCKTDIECPFYKQDSKRGGCDKLSGKCEMPVGTTRIAYRLYDGKPFCYGCTENLDCCDSKNRDYIFENDYKFRKDNNLNTYINIM